MIFAHVAVLERYPIRVERPSREICVWQAPNIKLLGETEAEVTAWLRSRYGAAALRRSRAERALLIWLDQPLLPYEYPKTARDLFRLAERAGENVSTQLAQIAYARIFWEQSRCSFRNQQTGRMLICSSSCSAPCSIVLYVIER